MKHIRIFALSLALVLMVGLFTACGKRGSVSESGSDAQSGASVSQSDESTPDTSTPEQGDVSVPDASQGEDKSEPSTPEVKPEVKPQQKPEVKPETPAPDFSIPATDPDETISVPIPGTKPEEQPAGVDLEAFYQTIFTDPANTPTMETFSTETLDAFYPGLTDIKTNQRVAYMASISAVPCEIIMVECANAADADAVKSIFQSRIDAQVSDHTNYPMVIEAWENEAKIAANGNFVALFVISGMTDQVVSNFNALF